MDFAREAAELLPYIQNHRRHIHQYPELSFREKETTEYIQKELESMGIEVIRFSDYYGLIGVLKGGGQGRPSSSVRISMPLRSGKKMSLIFVPSMRVSCMPAVMTATAPCSWGRRKFCLPIVMH